jgi:hypothetical protein
MNRKDSGQTEKSPQNMYSPIIPMSYLDIGVCYYCGCEADASDYVPPKKYFEFYLRSGKHESFAIVPSCKECVGFLEDCSHGLISERKTHINNQIGRKYLKALNIFKRWDKDEVKQLERTLASSIRAGISLGKEAQDRLRYFGFKYELNGNEYVTEKKEDKVFYVFGDVFSDYNHALRYASKSYKINIAVLENWLKEYGGNFDSAIDAYYAFKRDEILRKKKSKLCREFAKKYRQNFDFVTRTLEIYIKNNPNLPVENCLQLIFDDYVK